jgi:hypothetical protein
MWSLRGTDFRAYRCAGSNKAWVRARLEKHLEALHRRFVRLRQCGIVKTTEHDYHWRMLVPHKLWLSIMSELTREQTWGNFKREVAWFGGREDCHGALHEVWNLMAKLQWKEEHYEKRHEASTGPVSGPGTAG